MTRKQEKIGALAGRFGFVTVKSQPRSYISGFNRCLDHREEGDASDDWVACDNIDCKVYMHGRLFLPWPLYLHLTFIPSNISLGVNKLTVWCTGRQQKEDFENDESFFCLDCRVSCLSSEIDYV